MVLGGSRLCWWLWSEHCAQAGLYTHSSTCSCLHEYLCSRWCSVEDTGLGLRPSWHMQCSAKWLQGHVCAPHQVLCFCVLQSSLVCFWVKQAYPLLPFSPRFYCRSRKFLHILRENPSQSLASGHLLPGLGAWFGNRCSVWPEICSNGSDPTSRTSKERNFFCSVPVQV